VASPVNHPNKVVGQENVIMLLPPARMEWILPEDVRAVSVSFGFDPVAALQGTTDGADFFVELAKDDHVRPLLHRRLDPVRQPLDLGTHSVDLVLPPFGPGTRLVVRSGFGPDGNGAWDWMYLAGLRYHRSPKYLPEQFPGFSPVPDAADADGASLVRNGQDTQLFLHAPASLTYRLNGHERNLQFAYGFLPGAHSNGGGTDGAIFRVTLLQLGTPDRVLFERFLQPKVQPQDRGSQFENLALPAVEPGDRLLISIDPGPEKNAAWDWTYLRRLTLE
jgi:hypothetical protein